MAKVHANWHEDVFFGIHYDLHASADDTVLGKELTAEHLRERLDRVRPDWIQCDCKGHAGYTSWPTQVGSTSPGVVKDALRITRDVTKELGIRLGMHYSGVWDTRAVEVHPEWGRIDAKGERSAHMTCRMSGYTDELLIPQMLELVAKYDVDGFWVDGENWASAPCWCEKCQAEFTRRTGIKDIPAEAGQANWDAWLAFHRDLFIEHVTRYAEAVHAKKPECLICSNWMYTVRQPEPVRCPVDYLSGDYDWRWGVYRAAVEGRVLDSRGLPWDLMAWGFTKGGEMDGTPPWVEKTVTHLCQEVCEVVALGGAVMVYNLPQRTGWLTGWHQDLLGEVARFCRARQDVCFKSHTRSEAAVLHLADHYYAHNDPLYNYGEAVRPIEGALHVLLETQRSTDILLQEHLDRLDRYKLVVAPEQTRLSKETLAALETFARNGGFVIASGDHLARECSELVGVVADGDPLRRESSRKKDSIFYLPVDGRAVGTGGPWEPVRPAKGTEVLCCLMEEQESEKDTTDWPAVTRRKVGRGAVIAIHGPVFRDYFVGHYPLLRRFVAKLIDGQPIDWTVTAQGPSWLEIVVREKDERLLVNLVNRGSGETLYPNRLIIEQLPAIPNVTIRIRRESPPRQVDLAPDHMPVEWRFADGVLTVEVPLVHIHNILVVQ